MTNSVYGMTIMMMIMMMMMCYQSVVQFIAFGVIVLALMISSCSLALCWISRLHMISRGTTVTSVSEWLTCYNWASSDVVVSPSCLRIHFIEKWPN